jgi:hypothetical protein
MRTAAPYYGTVIALRAGGMDDPQTLQKTGSAKPSHLEPKLDTSTYKQVKQRSYYNVSDLKRISSRV